METDESNRIVRRGFPLTWIIHASSLAQVHGARGEAVYAYREPPSNTADGSKLARLRSTWMKNKYSIRDAISECLPINNVVFIPVDE